jgi:hypothetical protein
MFGFWGPAFNPDKDIPDLEGKVIVVTGVRNFELLPRESNSDRFEIGELWSWSGVCPSTCQA